MNLWQNRGFDRSDVKFVHPQNGRNPSLAGTPQAARGRTSRRRAVLALDANLDALLQILKAVIGVELRSTTPSGRGRIGVLRTSDEADGDQT